MCRYIVRGKRAHMEGYAKQNHSFLDKLNIRGRGRDTSSINLYMGDDNDEDEFLRNSGMARNTCCSLHYMRIITLWVVNFVASLLRGNL